MFNFKTASIGGILILVFLFILDMNFDVSTWWYIAVMLIHFGFVMWGSFSIQSQFYTKAINRFSAAANEVVITFDDGPDPDVTPKVLALLDKWNVKATFFCIGHKVEAHPEIVQAVFDAGHCVALHSYIHSYLYDFKLKKGLLEDLTLNQTVIKDAIGQTPIFFRPPYGVTTPYFQIVCKLMKLKVIGWSVRSLDTVVKDQNKVVERVMRKMSAGDILLLHDHLEKTPAVLDELLERISKANLKVVALEKKLNLNPYSS